VGLYNIIARALVAMMKEFVGQHPWLAGFILLLLGFVVNTFLRLRAISRKILSEIDLQGYLLGGAIALRKLGRAQRLLERYKMARQAVEGRPVLPKMVRRLWKASGDAGYAVRHLSRVRKKLADVGCPFKVLMHLEKYGEIAKATRESCRREVKSRSYESAGADLTATKITDLFKQSRELCEESKEVTALWANETQKANREIAATVDSVIYRSGGFLRRPFKAETLAEMQESRVVLELNRTKQDIQRVEEALAMVHQVLRGSESPLILNSQEMVVTIGCALDALDVALGDAELPLPEVLATGENPVDPPGTKPQGTLQRLYALLTLVEAFCLRAQTV
jgi:hypothetical protein